MTAIGPAAGHAALMDGIYRRQRHVYDATRKYYLLGRDRLIARLDVPAEGAVLEIGCGTGRNLLLAARRNPRASFYGIDISEAMLATARRNIGAGMADGRVALAAADATAFDPEELFGRAMFDRIYFSYALSMIPEWEKAIARAVDSIALGGSLHVVDFGAQENLPRWFRTLLRAWLSKFHVEPRAILPAELASQAERIGGRVEFTPLYRGYAWHVVLRRGTTAKAAAYSTVAARAAAIA